MMKRNLSVALSVFLATGLLSPALPVQAAPSINPYGTVQAEIEFERNVKEVFTDEDAGATVVSLGSGNYFSVKSVNFSQGVSKIGITAKADSAGLIIIHKGHISDLASLIDNDTSFCSSSAYNSVGYYRIGFSVFHFFKPRSSLEAASVKFCHIHINVYICKR